MRREFLINIGFLVAVNLLVKPLYIFGIDRTVQNLVGKESYGLYFALFNFVFLFGILNDLGIQNFTSRSVAQHRHLIGKYFSTLFLIKLILTIFFLAAVAGGAYFSGYGPETYSLLGWLALAQGGNALALFLRANLAGLGQYRYDSLLSALDRTLLVVVLGIWLWVLPRSGDFNIVWFAQIQALSQGVVLLVATALLAPHLKGIRFKWRPAFSLSLLRQALPFAIVILLMTIYTRIDSVMIERLLPNGASEAGIYAAAYRLLDAGNAFGYLFAVLLLPMFSRGLKSGEGLESLLDSSFRLLMAGSWTVAVAVFFYRQPISQALYAEATPYWGEVLGWLMWTFVAISGGYVFGTLLTASGRLGAMNRLFLITIALNIGLNLWLIPRYQAQGAVVATLFSQFLVLIGQVWLSRRLLGLQVARSTWMRWLGYAAAVGAVFALLHIAPFPVWYWELLLGLALSLGLAWVFGMVRTAALF